MSRLTRKVAVGLRISASRPLTTLKRSIHYQNPKSKMSELRDYEKTNKANWDERAPVVSFTIRMNPLSNPSLIRFPHSTQHQLITILMTLSIIKTILAML